MRGKPWMMAHMQRRVPVPFEDIHRVRRQKARGKEVRLRGTESVR
jgi:hypothetical protein